MIKISIFSSCCTCTCLQMRIKMQSCFAIFRSRRIIEYSQLDDLKGRKMIVADGIVLRQIVNRVDGKKDLFPVHECM